MQSYALYLQGLYSAMLSDIAERFPSLRVDCERDASRLLSLVESRGLSFFMIDLPDMGKHFDRCLSLELLTVSGIAGQRPYKKGVVIPRLFKGLLRRVFNDNGVLRVDSDVDCIRYLRQLYYAAKKVKVQCSDSRTWKQVHEFFEIDRKVRRATLSWELDELGIEHYPHRHLSDGCNDGAAPLFGLSHAGYSDVEESLAPLPDGVFACAQEVADVVTASIGRFEPSEWRAKHGPGAVADQRHTQFKYDFPSWPAKLERVFPMSEFGFSNLANWADFLNGKDSHLLYGEGEFPSKLISVPKTLKGPRLIASEPVAHQWCQQIIKDFLSRRLADTPISSAIHFRDQRENQEFARRASHDQSHATIDLSSASDRLSCWVIERVFRKSSSLLEAFHSSRTRWLMNAIDKKSPKYIMLRKFSCMGSAVTFPVQTYVFAILAISSVLYSRQMKVTSKNIESVSQEVRVFGDDIIVPLDGWETLTGLLGHLGLKVNSQKTYGIGRFRESCGLDAFEGNDVTPTYSMTYPEVSRPESIASCVDSHNNFVKRGYFATAKYVKSRVHQLRRFTFANVPIDSGAFGWWDVENGDNTHLPRRWNSDLQRLEVRVDVPCGKTTRILPNSNSVLLQFFTVARFRPLEYFVGDSLGHIQRAVTNIRKRWVTLP